MIGGAYLMTPGDAVLVARLTLAASFARRSADVLHVTHRIAGDRAVDSAR